MRKRVFWGIALGLVALVAWAFLRPTPSDRLNDVVAELRARGEPVSLPEMERPLPPEGQNGAPILEEALRWRAAFLEDDPGWEDRVVGPWNNTIPTLLYAASPEELAETRAFLQPLGPFYDAVSRAAACNEIVWPLGALDHFGYEFRSARVVQDVQRFLTGRAYASSTPVGRLAALRDMLAIGRRLRVRTPIDHLIASTVSASACRTLNDLLARGEIDAAAARASWEPLLRHSFRSDLPALLRGERAQLIEILPFWFDGRAAAALAPDETSFWEDMQHFARDARRGRLWRADPHSKNELPAALREMDAIIDLDPASGKAYVDALERFSDRWGSVFVVLPRIAQKSTSSDCHMALSRVALAACVVRDESGAWPAQSSALESLFEDGIPRDPYTDAPFVFEIEAGELVISAQPWPGVIDPSETLDELGLRVRLPPR